MKGKQNARTVWLHNTTTGKLLAAVNPSPTATHYSFLYANITRAFQLHSRRPSALSYRVTKNKSCYKLLIIFVLHSYKNVPIMYLANISAHFDTVGSKTALLISVVFNFKTPTFLCEIWSHTVLRAMPLNFVKNNPTKWKSKAIWFRPSARPLLPQPVRVYCNTPLHLLQSHTAHKLVSDN